MHKIITLVIVTLTVVLLPHKIFAVATPVSSESIITPAKNYTDSMMLFVANLSVKDVEKAIGHRLKFKEKIALKLLQYKIKLTGGKNVSFKEYDKKIEKKALWSKWLGIGSLIGLFIPGVGLLSIPAAIVAILLGTETINKTQNPRNSRQGITFGIITLALLLLAALILIAILSSFRIN